MLLARRKREAESYTTDPAYITPDKSFRRFAAVLYGTSIERGIVILAGERGIIIYSYAI